VTVWDDSADSIHDHGHRESIGGLWDEIGPLQFDFLVAQGLRPNDVLVDVACGSLRGGAHFIRYLEPRGYLGIEKRIELVIYGVAAELGTELYREKRPRFVISDQFEFHKFDRSPNFGIGQSIFTHLDPHDIVLCLERLKAHASPSCRYFASFREALVPQENASRSHAHAVFAYTQQQLAEFATRAGWSFRYIGNWNHPRKQMMAEFQPLP